MTSSDSVPNYDMFLMAIKRGVGWEDGTLLLLPDTKQTTVLVERFIFWHVTWKELKSLGWIIDTNAHGNHDFIVIPPFKSEDNSMKENIDFFSDEKMLINALADDPRFANKKKIVSLRKEYDEFVAQFKVLRDLANHHQKGNVLGIHSFPIGILLSNKCMLEYLKELVVQQSTRNTIHTLMNEEEKIRTEMMVRRERELEREHNLQLTMHRENMQFIMAEQELVKSELQRRAEEDKRLREEEIRATIKEQADDVILSNNNEILDTILTMDNLQRHKELVPSSVSSQRMITTAPPSLLTRKSQSSETGMSQQLLKVLAQTPVPPILHEPQLPTSTFLPSSRRIESGNNSDPQSILIEVAKAFREAHIPTVPTSNSKLQSISVLPPSLIPVTKRPRLR